ncbi:MAG TPA: DUF1080 domain-containing protein [Verrucomicrobiota bacterium]|nr:DUF1080 domain-containing protein [Verrucomicrobiota bacterium]HNU52274.1 DUF1080 domain-containing protein [Verrucomicrobiota bacterium]
MKSPVRAFTTLVACWMTAAAAGAERTFDLTTETVGKPPRGWRSTLAGTGSPGDWHVVLDDAPTLFAPFSTNAPATRKIPVIAQLSQDPTDERFPLLVYDNEVYRDFTLSLRFKTVAGKVEQMAGVVFRLQDERNFYVVRASSLGRNLRFYRVAEGVRDQPLGPTLEIPLGTWHQLSVECRGNRIRLRLDDKDAMPEITDNSYLEGKIGLWTKSDAVSHFTDIRVNFTPREPQARALVRDVLQRYPRIKAIRVFSTTSQRPDLHVIAADDDRHLGQPGGKYEKQCIDQNLPLAGASGKIAIVTYPLQDRNGDPIAAVRLELERRKGQSNAEAVARARPILQRMQAQVTSLKDLSE